MSALRSPAWAVALALVALQAHAGLFEDDEARKAILDLRQRHEALRLESDRLKEAVAQARKAAGDDSASLGRSLLELQRQLDGLRAELAALRGNQDVLSKQVADAQRAQKDQLQALTDRLAKLEPAKVTVDGVEFLAEPQEQRSFEAALALFRKGSFDQAQAAFAGFINRYPGSAYTPSALFWLGNAQYATKNYKEAMENFRSLVAGSPNHVRAPEAVLSVANCQIELKDLKGARKTLTDLQKAYPQSEAAAAAKERLALLK